MAKNSSMMTEDSQILSHAGEGRLKHDNEAAGRVDRKNHASVKATETASAMEEQGRRLIHRPELAAKKMKGLGNKKPLFIPSETQHSFTNVLLISTFYRRVRRIAKNDS
jgi:hypothetical protein